MSGRDELLALAAKVEAASGPDREMDARIAPFQGLRVVQEGHPLGRCIYDVNGHGVPLPSYTASLDAAMTLVPVGMPWAVEDPANADGSRSIFGYPSRCRAYVEGGPNPWDYGKTPALALTAAALRARAGAA